MALRRGMFSTVTKIGRKMIDKSTRVSPSTKRPKVSGPVFGASSQFKGVGRGVPGDLRK
jgi:hypothetical protein